MHKIFRFQFLLIIITIFVSCKKDVSSNNITTIKNDTTSIYGNWQWYYDIHNSGTVGTNYTTSPSSTTKLMLAIDTGKTYSVVLNNETITSGNFSDTSNGYQNERVVTFQNPFNINSVNFMMATNAQWANRVNATLLFLSDYEPFSIMDGSITHVFKIVP